MKNNHGISNILIISILLIILSVGGYYGYPYLNNPIIETDQSFTPKNTSDTQQINSFKTIIYLDEKPFKIVKDTTNNFTLKIDTSQNLVYDNYSEAKINELDFRIEYLPNGLEITPKTAYPIGANSWDRYSITYHNGKLNPGVFWEMYKELPNFKYTQLDINGFKAYTTNNLPGQGTWYSTLVEINDIFYLEINYYPISLINNPQINDSEVPENYNLNTKSLPAFNYYLEILKSIKKIN